MLEQITMILGNTRQQMAVGVQGWGWSFKIPFHPVAGARMGAL